jgi:hypothetical protein
VGDGNGPTGGSNGGMGDGNGPTGGSNGGVGDGNGPTGGGNGGVGDVNGPTVNGSGAAGYGNGGTNTADGAAGDPNGAIGVGNGGAGDGMQGHRRNDRIEGVETGKVGRTVPSEPEIERRKRTKQGCDMALHLRRAFRFPISGAVRTQRPTLPTVTSFRQHKPRL